MKWIAWSFVLALLLAACSTGADLEHDGTAALYNKYDEHCREHAREIVGEKDEESRYQDCMNYFIKTDVNCPICGVDLHLTKHKE